MFSISPESLKHRGCQISKIRNFNSFRRRWRQGAMKRNFSKFWSKPSGKYKSPFEAQRFNHTRSSFACYLRQGCQFSRRLRLPEQYIAQCGWIWRRCRCKLIQLQLAGSLSTFWWVQDDQWYGWGRDGPRWYHEFYGVARSQCWDRHRLYQNIAVYESKVHGRVHLGRVQDRLRSPWLRLDCQLDSCTTSPSIRA